MFTPKEVLIAIAIFFCAVSGMGAILVSVLAHIAARNEAEEKARDDRFKPSASVATGTHELVSR